MIQGKGLLGRTLEDLGLDRVVLLYPGDRRYSLAVREEAVPRVTLARPRKLFPDG